MRRRIAGTGALALTLLALGAGCGDGSGPTAGAITVTLIGPAPVRAVMFRMVGAHDGITIPGGGGFKVYATPLGGDTVRVALLAPVGAVLSSSFTASVTVPDTRRRPTLILEQVAGADYALQNAATYSLTFVTLE